MSAQNCTVPQWRKKGCADWYDGYPDHEDGGGPYEERTLYANKPHDTYKTGDIGAPASICDRNGDVVLTMCKVCGKAENELTQTCSSDVNRRWLAALLQKYGPSEGVDFDAQAWAVVHAAIKEVVGHAHQFPTIVDIKASSYWVSETQHHVPTLLLEFEAVPAISSFHAKGWVDRDAMKKILSEI